MQKFVTVNRLSEITRADRRSVKKWLAIEGVEPANEGEKPARYDMERAVAAIAKHKDKRAKNDPNVDPKTGLTWFQLKTKAEALTKMRELKLAEAMDRKQLMKMEDYQEVMCIIWVCTIICGRFWADSGFLQAFS